MRSLNWGDLLLGVVDGINGVTFADVLEMTIPQLLMCQQYIEDREKKREQAMEAARRR